VSQIHRRGIDLAVAGERVQREVDVEVRRWRRRADRSHAGDEHADRVADEQRAEVGLEGRDVVLGVAGGVEQLQAPPATEVEDVTVGDAADPLDGDRGAVAVDGVVQLAVDAAGAGVQPVRRDEMAGADLADDHRGPWERGGDVASAARVVEVDVAEHEVGEVAGAHSQTAQCGDHRADAERGPALHEGGPWRVEQVTGGDSIEAGRQRVDDL
jgi:hypothetical protein